ncbi:MAG TPA: hypothetical protein VFN61_08750 [Acidimicrobiales bacterium]|nr:hypothetical protein [Acidimicrobiales bacterium]
MSRPFSRQRRAERQRPAAADLQSLVVKALYEGLMIDDEWAAPRANGFTWWAYRLAQHVEATPFEAPDGARGCRLHVWTDVVAGVRGAEQAVGLLAPVNALQSMSASSFDPASATITDSLTAVVYEETADTLMPVVAMAAILQNTAAHSHAHAMAEATGGCPAASQHPGSGQRPEMDEMLTLPADMASNAGTEASAFAGDLVSRLGPFAGQMGLCANGDPEGFTAEVPCTGPLTTAEALDASGKLQPVDSALVQVGTDQGHPELGAGALVTMRLPFVLAPQDAAAAANELNRLELDPVPFSTLGAWCTSPEGDGCAFVSFIPSTLARPGLLENFLVWDTVRARWAGEALTRILGQ